MLYYYAPTTPPARSGGGEGMALGWHLPVDD